MPQKNVTLEVQAGVCVREFVCCVRITAYTSECVWSKYSRGTAEVACGESFGGSTEAAAEGKQKGSLAPLQPLLYSPCMETLIPNMSLLDLWHVFRASGTRADFLFFFSPSYAGCAIHCGALEFKFQALCGPRSLKENEFTADIASHLI